VQQDATIQDIKETNNYVDFALWEFSTINHILKLQYYFVFTNFSNFILVVRVPGYRSRDPGSIPGTTRFSDK
jgi:hypothetical protein